MRCNVRVQRLRAADPEGEPPRQHSYGRPHHDRPADPVDGQQRHGGLRSRHPPPRAHAARRVHGVLVAVRVGGGDQPWRRRRRRWHVKRSSVVSGFVPSYSGVLEPRPGLFPRHHRRTRRRAVITTSPLRPCNRRNPDFVFVHCSSIGEDSPSKHVCGRGSHGRVERRVTSSSLSSSPLPIIFLLSV